MCVGLNKEPFSITSKPISLTPYLNNVLKSLKCTDSEGIYSMSHTMMDIFMFIDFSNLSQPDHVSHMVIRQDSMFMPFPIRYITIVNYYIYYYILDCISQRFLVQKKPTGRDKLN